MRLYKLCILALSALVIIASVAVLPERLCFKSGGNYVFYCGTSSADCREVTVTTNAALEKLLLKDVCGECTVYENLDLESFLEEVGGKIVAREELSDSVNYYCKANLPYSVNLYGTEINLHVSVRGDTAKVASPIIFGGY